jgi:hypothetical protein
LVAILVNQATLASEDAKCFLIFNLVRVNQ